MKRKKANASIHLNKNNSTYSLMAWISFALFALLFLISPYQRGLFFDTDYFSISMAIHALFLLSLVLLFPVVKEQVIQQSKMLLVLFAVPLIYTLSFWYSYLPSAAAYEALQWFSYALLFFMLLVWMAAEERLKEWLWLLAWGTMLWITGLVFLVHFQVLEFQDALLGRRFSSVFQYPNTFAALLSVFVIVGLMNLTKRLNRVHTCLYAFSLFPFLLAFLLTESRGALLVFAAAWVLGLFFLSWREQLLYAGYSVLLMLVGFWGYTNYGEWMQEELIAQSAALLIGLSVLLGLLLLVVQYMFVQRQTLAVQSKWSFLAPTLLTVVGALSLLVAGSALRDKLVQLFPEGLQRRVASISLDEAYSRILFFKDAFVVWKDHFFLGTGGGGWRALFESYKSLPYYSTQAHSFYMQTLVEVGLIGSVVVFGFLVYVVAKGIRVFFRKQGERGVEQETSQQQEKLRTGQDDNQHQERLLLSSAIMGALILLLHSAIDFNMSFGTYNLFLFLFLAIIWSYAQGEPWFSKLLRPAVLRLQERMTEKVKLALMYSFVGVLGLCSLFAAYTSYAYNQAEHVQAQLQQGGDIQVMLGQVEKAISYNSHDVRFRQLKLTVLNHAYQQTGDAAWLEQMKEEYEQILDKEPKMYQHYLQYAQFLWGIEEKEEALELKLQALAVAPWQQSVYEDVIASGVEYVQEVYGGHQDQEQGEGESQGEEERESSASALLQELERVMQQYEAQLLVQVEEAPEGFTPGARIRRNYDHQLNMAKLYLLQEQYAAALEALRVYIPESWQEQDWYLELFVEEDGQEKEKVRPFYLQTLQEDLQGYLDGEYVVVLAGKGAMARHLSQPVKDLLAQTGATIANLAPYDSYVGVIAQGKMVAEQMDGKKPVEITNESHPELSQVLADQEFSFYSAGHELGNESAIVWQGEDYSRNGRGLNMVVLDKNLQVIERIHYDTHIWDYKIVVKEEE